ncbi:chorismate synthase [Desulfurispirillum indicum S5]|uniref:Chorismate synthase n=1 Tax=Desulfurispirillum indicum (strain ATCC BAA-1389 / DSM 22839 / S5) TaxID=653733 RepID=E6W1L0_DESIS|nr:chorismate synthase [Desulfurispirillum indicum]ADU66559.1 chorismate synthase [Desulfurispirillum indicum S5]
MRYITAGESHGRGLFAIVENFPAGLSIDAEYINTDLRRRQMGYGRGGRMKIETDAVEFLSGVRWGKTFGSPITMAVWNRDNKNWQSMMSPLASEENPEARVRHPRPGHADLGGCLKRNMHDVRNILERSSARETAIRVALGGLCRRLLEHFGVSIQSHVCSIGAIESQVKATDIDDLTSISARADQSIVRFLHTSQDDEAREYIDTIRRQGNTLGGVIEIIVTGVVPGLGDYASYGDKLDGRIGQALLGMQAIKGVEIGIGFEAARRPGSEVHDEIFFDQQQHRFYRGTNRAGGIEGGMSNGMPMVIRVAKKPIPTLYTPLKSVDIDTKEPYEATIERSDTTAVPAASVITEAICATVIAQAYMEKFGHDSLEEMLRNFHGYQEQLRHF